MIDPFSFIIQEQKHGLKRHKHQKIEQGKGYNMILINQEQKHRLKRHKHQKIEQGKGYNMV